MATLKSAVQESVDITAKMEAHHLAMKDLQTKKVAIGKAVFEVVRATAKNPNAATHDFRLGTETYTVTSEGALTVQAGPPVVNESTEIKIE